ncbi:isopentenyl-diphosphate delta-isomerase [Anncaliia algerae PRA339]|uniref:isopentenyl-diphosphate Delta-isomerase n=1 Tax=Anncaliia algerae PRA339 TaxID=1288291 RepID=A0A059F3L6_9MICR|nr:isopentenyl-diphosphate delta-isomerase [Anncaliia algerae PRA339]
MDNYNRNLVIVNDQDEIIGTKKALNAHLLNSLTLHRAFSVFIFNHENKLMIQKRAQSKLVYPGLWSNTCCSHPFLNINSFSSPVDDCINHGVLRLQHELNINVKKEDFIFYERMLYKATNEESFFRFLGKDVNKGEIKEYEDKETLQWKNKGTENYGEYEVDYLFLIKKDVEYAENPTEVEECRFVNYYELEELALKNELTPWFAMIFNNLNIFKMI